jgi:hypothetical protein
VCYTHLFFIYNFCHHGCAVDSAPSQQDPYLSPQKDFKLIVCLVQELWWSKVKLTNPDAAGAAAAGAAAAGAAIVAH